MGGDFKKRVYTELMNATKRKIIHDFAVRLRTVFQVESPVKLDELVTRLAGTIVEAKLDDGVSGKIEKTDGAFRITVNPQDAPNRIVFTIAHELGHLFLHMGYLVNPDRWNTLKEAYIDSVYFRSGFSEEEYEANEFAGAFLMPEPEFRERYLQYQAAGQDPISELSQFYLVSTEAVSNRCKWLGILPW